MSCSMPLRQNPSDIPGRPWTSDVTSTALYPKSSCPAPGRKKSLRYASDDHIPGLDKAGHRRSSRFPVPVPPIPRSIYAAIRGGSFSLQPVLSSTRAASAKVELSGAVGPEAITSRLSPTTSERISETTMPDRQPVPACLLLRQTGACGRR